MDRLLFLLIFFVFSCHSSKRTTKHTAKISHTIEINEQVRGGELILNNDCTTCHKTTQKMIGPAFIDIAYKYDSTETNINRLIKKIKSGGQGVWSKVPMTPHPELAEPDAREIVKYILSLKNL